MDFNLIGFDYTNLLHQVEHRWRNTKRILLPNGVKVEGKINPGRQPHISKTVSMPGPAFYIPKAITDLKIKKRLSSKEKSKVSFFILHQDNALNDLI
jgi:hypothetical protein